MNGCLFAELSIIFPCGCNVLVRGKHASGRAQYTETSNSCLAWQLCDCWSGWWLLNRREQWARAQAFVQQSIVRRQWCGRSDDVACVNRAQASGVDGVMSSVD
jgi:hypothetical protein